MADKLRDKMNQTYVEKGSRKLLELHFRGGRVTLCGDHVRVGKLEAARPILEFLEEHDSNMNS